MSCAGSIARTRSKSGPCRHCCRPRRVRGRTAPARASPFQRARYLVAQPPRREGGFRSRPPPRVAAEEAQGPELAMTRLNEGAGCGLQPFAGPRASIRACVAPRAGRGRAEWLREAGACAMLGSCPRSTASIRSGVQCWFDFARATLGDEAGLLPPALEALLSWSNHFRCAATFANYLGHVKLACLLVGASRAVFKHEAVGRAKTAIAKRQLFDPRRKLFFAAACRRGVSCACGAKASPGCVREAFDPVIRFPLARTI